MKRHFGRLGTLSSLVLCSTIAWATGAPSAKTPRVVVPAQRTKATSPTGKPAKIIAASRSMRLAPTQNARASPSTETRGSLVHAIVADQQRQSPTNIKTFRVVLRDGNGAVLTNHETPEQFDVAWTRDTDTLDLAPYYHEGKQLLMGVTEAMRPTLATRSDGGSAVHTGSPAGIVRPEDGDVSFDRAARRVLQAKVGTEAAGPLESLGGSDFPSVGHSPELAYPRAIRSARTGHRKISVW